MKKMLFLLTTMFTVVASACWFGFGDFFFYPSGRLYISSVNWKHFHVKEHNSSLNKIFNGQEVDLPISVQIKVGDLDVIEKAIENIEEDGTTTYRYFYKDTVPLENISLVYRVERDGKVVVKDTIVKNLSYTDWKMSFDKPVDVFGANGLIDIPEGIIKQGDAIVVYLGVEQTYSSLFDDAVAKITIPQTPTENEYYLPKQTSFTEENNRKIGEYLVFKVIYSGKRRIII